MKMTPRSSVSEIVWPGITADKGAALLAMAFQLDQTEWWSPQDLQAHQQRQISVLLRHARETVPWYRGRLDEEALTPEGWQRIPLLTKQDIRQHQADLVSDRVPLEHGKLHRNKTSGSTGEPLEVILTEVNGFFWESVAFRDDRWHERDMRGRYVVIRSGRYAPDPLAVHDMPAWGLTTSALYKTGPMTLFYHTMPLSRQAEVLEARSPHYILTYPSNARALCRLARERPLHLPDLRAVHTYGEPLTPDVRAACRKTWGVPVHDVYSCEEMGFIALQCPAHEHYHVQAESVLVEVLDDQGQPCAPGQIGRVVLTPLHNFAMPLIRYAIGDYAEVGGPCPCGRGLPVLRRILGRARSRVMLPGGRRTWPDIGALWAAIPGLEQIQVVQHDHENVEVRYARQGPLGASEEPAARAAIQKALGHPFRLMFTAMDVIARQPNGKYETFMTRDGA